MDTQDQKNNSTTTEDSTSQVDEALNDIRKAMTSETNASSEVLELTEVIEESEEPNNNASDEASHDVLQKIDNNANVKKAKNPPPQLQEEESMEKKQEQEKNNTESTTEEPDEISVKQSTNNTESPKEPSNNSNNKAFIAEEVAQKSQDLLKSFIKATSKNHGSDELQFRGGYTLEDLVVELLKPQLSEWLNKNLPNIVQKIVEKEIKKLIPQDE